MHVYIVTLEVGCKVRGMSSNAIECLGLGYPEYTWDNPRGSLLHCTPGPIHPGILSILGYQGRSQGLRLIAIKPGNEARPVHPGMLSAACI